MTKRNVKWVQWIFVLVAAVCILFSVGKDSQAATKESNKNKVYKEITSVKSGKYTYFRIDETLYRQKAGGKKVKLTKYEADGEIMVKGNYIYYDSNGRLRRVSKNGKQHKNYKVSVWDIELIKDNYIYFSNATGLYRISVAGKNKEKILSYTKNSKAVFVGDRIFYINAYGTNDNYTWNEEIQSVNLNGKDKKSYAIFQDKHQVKIVTDGKYVYISTGDELGVIDTTAENPEYVVLDTCTVDEENSDSGCVAIAAIDGMVYFHDYSNLYAMDAAGNKKTLTKLLANDEQGVKLVKQGNYFWLRFLGDDTLSSNFIYDKDWKLKKKITKKYGEVVDLQVKNKKIYVQYSDSEDMNMSAEYVRYKIYNLK